MKLKLETKQIPKESKVILGCSGGRDSMALVHALMTQRPDLKIIVAHVDHNLRPDSKATAEFTKGMMMRWQLDFVETKLKKPETGNIEEWGRQKRYEFFEKQMKKYKADMILTAHHQDDDYESMFLHFLRGTRVKGLSGMQIMREDIFRPMLFTPRTEIDEYIVHHEIPFKDDPTNEDITFRRNFFRHKVVPLLKHMNPDLAERWQRQKDYWLELQDLLERTARAFMEEYLDKKEGLDRAAYSELAFPLRATVLELWFKDTTGSLIPDSATIERWDEAIREFDPRKKTEWYDGTFLVMKKDRAVLA